MESLKNKNDLGRKLLFTYIQFKCFSIKETLYTYVDKSPGLYVHKNSITILLGSQAYSVFPKQLLYIQTTIYANHLEKWPLMTILLYTLHILLGCKLFGTLLCTITKNCAKINMVIQFINKMEILLVQMLIMSS